MGSVYTGHCDWCGKQELFCMCLSEEDKAEIAKEAESVKVNWICMPTHNSEEKFVFYYKGVHFLAFPMPNRNNTEWRILVGFDISEEEQENDSFDVLGGAPIDRVVARAAVRWDRYRKRIGYTKE